MICIDLKLIIIKGTGSLTETHTEAFLLVLIKANVLASFDKIYN